MGVKKVLTKFQQCQIANLEKDRYMILKVKPNQDFNSVRYACYWMGRYENKKFSVHKNAGQAFVTRKK